MPFNGAGAFTRAYSWTLDAAQSINILPDRMDNDANDIAAGLSNCLTRDAQAPMLAPIPMGGFQINNLGTPLSATDAATKAYVDTPTQARNMAGFQINNLGTPTSAGDAATKAYVDAGSITSLPLSGASPMQGALQMGGFKIVALGTPAAGTDAATKAYVDAQAYAVTLPSQAGFGGCELTTDGAGLVSWSLKAKRHRMLGILSFIS